MISTMAEYNPDPKEFRGGRGSRGRNWIWPFPLVSLFGWWGMLVALLACWTAQGKPLLSQHNLGESHIVLVYLSTIGATNLQPLFISGAGLQGLFFFLSFVGARVYRRNGTLLRDEDKHQTRASWAQIPLSFMTSASIIIVTACKSTVYDHVHLTFVGLFIAFAFFTIITQLVELWGLYKSHTHDTRARKWLLTMFIFDIVFLIVGIGLAAGYGGLRHRSGYAATCEWALCFWYGIYLIMLSLVYLRH